MRNFSLHGFSKHPHWFRCSGKGEHLNLAARQSPAAKPLTTNVLQDFQQLCPWFRSQPVLEHRRTQIRPGGASCRGIHQTRSRVTQASEPEQNSKNQPQFIEKLSVVRFQQASPLVQMQRKREASEPRRNPKNPLQHIEKLSITRIQQAPPPVQMQRKREASEPCGKAESSSQPANNKRIAKLSTTMPVVQIPTCFGTPQNANALWRHF